MTIRPSLATADVHRLLLDMGQQFRNNRVGHPGADLRTQVARARQLELGRASAAIATWTASYGMDRTAQDAAEQEPLAHLR